MNDPNVILKGNKAVSFHLLLFRKVERKKERNIKEEKVTLKNSPYNITNTNFKQT